MDLDSDWPRHKKNAYFTARRDFMAKETAEAIREKIHGIERMLEKGAGDNPNNNYTTEGLKQSLDRWVTRLEKGDHE